MVMVIKSNVPSNTIANPDGWNPPFNTDGMLYVGIYGRGIAKNFAKNGVDVVVSGSPVVNNHFAKFTANDFIDTGIENTKQATLITITKRKVEAHRQFLISSYNGGKAFGRSVLFGSGAGALTMYSHYTGQNASGEESNISFSTYFVPSLLDGSPAFIYARDTGKTLSLGDVTGNKNNSNTAPGTMESFVTPGLTYMIGRSHDKGEVPADNEIAAAMIFDRALSDAEITAIYAYFQGYFARRGISI
ncbi:hypothetical protein [Klebsiella pneumoniae]|uniref:hypothetical protein n=1 Tax=Klebsiella pneumoniae TaxID=573 RepID=UPI00265C2737|nr:hypothetical protein [Klebsiella pneumoniae]MDO0715697.1 hypothetical protein [Klebsiella pneumoniae]HEN5337363.1 hypothetical protein [Klebsiella pneumoniae]